MKKVLTSVLFLMFVTSAAAYSEDATYTGALLNSFQKKIDNVAAPVVNKEKQVRDQQAAIQAAKQNQAIERQREIEAQQRAQQELINKKKQQLQSQKDLLNQQKQELKSLFSIQ